MENLNLSCIKMSNQGATITLINDCDIRRDEETYKPVLFSRRTVQADVRFSTGKILSFRIDIGGRATFGLIGNSATIVGQRNPTLTGESAREQVQLYLENDGDYWLNCFRPTYVLLRRTLTNLSNPSYQFINYEDWVVGGSLGAYPIGGGPSSTERTEFTIIDARFEPVERH